MFCTKCGKELAEGTNFCVSCGAPVSNTTTEVTQNQYNNETPAQEYTAIGNRKEKNPTALIITLSVIVVVLVIITVILLLNKPSPGGTSAPTAESRTELVIESYPEETEDVSYILSGTITSTGDDAVLTVDGEEIISISKGEENISWSTELWLSKGVNSFELALTTAEGEVDNQIVEIEYNPGLLYSAGTILVKSDPAGIFVRPTPAITKEYILYLPYYDYTTQLVCQGEEYVDGEGFVWCKVTIPSGKSGWVRSDIIRAQ